MIFTQAACHKFCCTIDEDESTLKQPYPSTAVTANNFGLMFLIILQNR